MVSSDVRRNTSSQEQGSDCGRFISHEQSHLCACITVAVCDADGNRIEIPLCPKCVAIAQGK